MTNLGSLYGGMRCSSEQAERDHMAQLLVRARRIEAMTDAQLDGVDVPRIRAWARQVIGSAAMAGAALDD